MPPEVHSAFAPYLRKKKNYSLKNYILTKVERNKKDEAYAEEQRLWQERVAEQQQCLRNLKELRETLDQYESDLIEFKNQKQELVALLKKINPEEDNIKETTNSSESMPTNDYIDQGAVEHLHTNSITNLPLPPRTPRYEIAAATHSHTLMSNQVELLKKSHSRPPPLFPPVSSYHPGHGYKPPPSVASYIPTSSKSPIQFPGSSYYRPALTQCDFGPPSTSQPLTCVPEPDIPVDLITTRVPLPTTQTTPYTEDKFYPRPGSHVAVHGVAVPIQQLPQGSLIGGIATGYPVRAPQPPQGPYPPSLSDTYVSVAGVNDR